jgi:sugar phosphate isomerase/epimerase
MFFKGTDQIIEETKAIGAHYVVIPWIPHTGKFTLEDAHTAAANFNKWGAALREAGLQLGYHPHGYEFTDAGNGKTVFDVMMGETKPELVTYELDVFWAFHGGQDPVKLLQKYPERFTLMHLKDMKKGTQTGLSTGQAPKTADVAIGTGQLDFPAIMKEARKVGIKHYYIEDESPTSVEQIPQSLKYLRSLGGGGD